jgi:hypothetical protein
MGEETAHFLNSASSGKKMMCTRPPACPLARRRTRPLARCIRNCVPNFAGDNGLQLFLGHLNKSKAFEDFLLPYMDSAVPLHSIAKSQCVYCS